ncbi:MAG: flagellar hook capping FlgD N-terminal domain-containing protein [Thermodesulfobacteriota bacterium]|nr:flagellar hook capping FlgD N-terminal domain-containing protein [Thermodesulfobacteriota bacterium]
MAIAGVDSILANQTPISSDKDTSNEITQDDFFSLLVSQLQYQDPLDPVKNTEFTAQLAQFTSLELQKSTSKSMEEMLRIQGSMNNMSALNFIGKEISGTGNICDYSGGEVSLDFELSDNAQDVNIGIYSGTGELVRSLSMDTVPEGLSHCIWDGTDASGNEVAHKRYSFDIEATDYNGNSIGTKTSTTGTVDGIRYDGGYTYLIIGDKEISISEVEKILQKGEI